LVFTLQPLSGTLKRGHPTLRDACIATNSTQTGSQSDATTARTALDGMVKAIMDKRIAVQYAADAEWPYTNKANAGIRREFFLPPDHPANPGARMFNWTAMRHSLSPSDGERVRVRGLAAGWVCPGAAPAR
jgi:hypothetical protein